MAWNTQASCLSLLRAGIIDVHSETQLVHTFPELVLRINPGVSHMPDDLKNSWMSKAEELILLHFKTHYKAVQVSGKYTLNIKIKKQTTVQNRERQKVNYRIFPVFKRGTKWTQWEILLWLWNT